MDRILKPMWPQQFQQITFDIKGLPAPLQLTSGNDLGGIEQSLHAYCVAFHADMPQWTIEWHTPSQPTFRLLPLEAQQYSPMQLMAVFRALRYNSFFKAISFRDVDLSALVRKKDYSQYRDSVVQTSLNGKALLHSCMRKTQLIIYCFRCQDLRGSLRKPPTGTSFISGTPRSRICIRIDTKN